MDVRPLQVVKLAIAAAGVAGFVWMLTAGFPRGQAKLYTYGGIAAVVLAYMGADYLDQRDRRRRVAARLAALGFEEAPAPEGAVHYTPEKKHHSFGVVLYAEAQWRGRRSRVADFKYETGHGKANKTWRNFQAAIECPPEWPEMELDPPVGLASRPISQLFGEKGARTGDEAFDRRWRIRAADGEGALVLMTPALRAWLLESPRKERWCIRGGWLSCTWGRACDERSAERVLARVAMFLSRAGQPAGAA
ncbi:MAG: hypothetical protein WD749_01855 [Phycisphaerales bacterium]